MTKSMKSALSVSFLCFIFFSVVFPSPSSGAPLDNWLPQTDSTNGNCAAALSSDLKLHVPIITFYGKSYYADFEVIPDSLEIQLTSSGLLTDVGPFVGCRPSLLSPDLTLHIPTILFGGSSYLADFEYSHDLSLALIGAGQTENVILYQLSSASSFQEGCVSPCLCPVTIGLEMSGTFKMVRMNLGPLFDRFGLDEVSWTVANSDGTVVHTIKGFGIYQRGGELANMHQLILELSIDGGDLIHFDSGLIPDGSLFPAILISVDRGTACYDIFMNIIANPSE
jgi:hypothetical protein